MLLLVQQAVLMISTSKSTLCLNNLKIIRPKVTKNLTNLHKKFCESPPRAFHTFELDKFAYCGLYRANFHYNPNSLKKMKLDSKVHNNYLYRIHDFSDDVSNDTSDSKKGRQNDGSVKRFDERPNPGK